jgi:2-oxoglutarate ferredoxin oxidoreductase subunit delta
MNSKSSGYREKATRDFQIVINKDRCKGCSYCVDFCNKGVLAMGEETNAKGYYLPAIVKGNECVGCGLCEEICPDFAIRVVHLDGETGSG